MTDTHPEAAHAASEFDDEASGERLPEGAAICGLFCALALVALVGVVGFALWAALS